MLSRISNKTYVLLALGVVVQLAASALIFFAAHARGLDTLGLMGDAKGYLTLAQHIQQFGVFSFSNMPPFLPESFRSPGYPFFLSILLDIVRTPLSAYFAQAILLGSMPVLLYLLFKPYHERAAWWGSILFMLEPARLFYTAALLSDGLFVCLFLGSLILLERGRVEGSRWSFVFCGILLGASILVRPIAVFLPLLYALYLLFDGRSKQALIAAAALCLAAVIIVAPWSYRNHRLFGSWNISSVGTANLMLYNAPEFLQFRPDARGQMILTNFQQEQQALPGPVALSLARSGIFTSTFFAIIRGHELAYAGFHLIKMTPFFLTDGLRDIIRLFNVDIGAMPNITTALLKGHVSLVLTYLRQGGLPILLLVLGSGFWSIVTLLYLWSAYTVLSRRLWQLGFLLVVLVAYFAILTGPVSNARYRMPAEGMLLIGAAGAILKRRD